MDKEALIRFRNAILKTVSEMTDEDVMDRLEIELLENNLLEPRNYKDNKKVLQKNFYENQKWKR